MRGRNAPGIYKIEYISLKETSGMVHLGTMLRTQLGELRRSGIRGGGGGRAQEAKKGQEGGKRCRRGCGASKHTHAAEGRVWTRRGGAGHRTPDHTCQSVHAACSHPIWSHTRRPTLHNGSTQRQCFCGYFRWDGRRQQRILLPDPLSINPFFVAISGYSDSQE